MSVINTIGKPFKAGFGLWAIKQQMVEGKANIQLLCLYLVVETFITHNLLLNYIFTLDLSTSANHSVK